MLRKLLRSVGIALILLPEPFTTPLGIALLGSAYLLARSRKAADRKRMRELIKLYLRHAQPHSHTGKIAHSGLKHSLKRKLADFDWPSEPAVPDKITHHTIDSGRLFLLYGGAVSGSMRGKDDKSAGRLSGEKVIHHSLSRRFSDYDWPGQPLVSEKTVHHTIDSRRLLLHYGGMTGNSVTNRGREGVEKVVYHSLKRGLSGYVLPSHPVVPEQSIHHTLDSKRLLQHYRKSQANYTAGGYYAGSGKTGTSEKVITHSINQARLLLHYQKSVTSGKPAVSALSYN